MEDRTRVHVFVNGDVQGKGFREAFSSSDAVVTDISHGRTVLHVEGSAAEELLQNAAPVDFGMAAFPPGSVAQTAVHLVVADLDRDRGEHPASREEPASHGG